MNLRLVYHVLPLALLPALAISNEDSATKVEALRGQRSENHDIASAIRSGSGSSSSLHPQRRLPPKNKETPPPSPCLVANEGPCKGKDSTSCCDGYSCSGKGGSSFCQADGGGDPSDGCPSCVTSAIGTVDCDCPANLTCNSSGSTSSLSNYKNNVNINVVDCDLDYCCSDGNGGYYRGYSCGWAQGVQCCPEGMVYTNRGCVPLDCCDHQDTEGWRVDNCKRC